ncbi:hypothetical protein HDV06_005882 [Boothiomyces sp. JEL0866]|nr:hypothetical protein HDV06_005882 [Boothiomyces sp. JEL0866]
MNAEIYTRSAIEEPFQPISKSGLKKELKWAKIYHSKLLKSQKESSQPKQDAAGLNSHAPPDIVGKMELYDQLPCVRIDKVAKYVDKQVKVGGWVHRQRVQGKKMKFIVLRDGYGYLQCVVSKELCETMDMQELTAESSITVCGTIRKLPEGKQAPNGIEMDVEAFDIISKAPGGDNAFGNILNAAASPSLLLDKRHMVLRGETASACMKFRSIALKAFRDYFDSKNLCEVTPPLLVETQAEGGSNVFTVDYYGKPAYLTQSSQLYLETVLPSLGDNYCITESFRAENSATRRHLSQFTHIEAELGFITFNDLLNFIEDMLVTVTKSLVDNPKSAAIIQELNPTFTPPQRPFLRMEYKNAISWLQEHNIEKDIYINDIKVAQEPYKFGDDILESAERFMTDKIGQPILLTKFPVKLKAFYMKKCSLDPRLTESVDVLMPGVGEITGASMRISDYTELIEAYNRDGIDPAPYYWFTDQRKYGSVEHGGFGLGIERYLAWILNRHTVREHTDPINRSSKKIKFTLHLGMIVILRKQLTARQRNYQILGYCLIILVTAILIYFGVKKLAVSGTKSDQSEAISSSNKVLVSGTQIGVGLPGTGATSASLPIPTGGDHSDQLPSAIGKPLTDIVSDVASAQAAYDSYKAQFGKTNPPDKELLRLTLFTKHLQFIQAYNDGQTSATGSLNSFAVANNPSSLKLGINQFSDLSRASYKKLLTAKPDQSPTSKTIPKGNLGNLPPAVQLVPPPTATPTPPSVPIAKSDNSSAPNPPFVNVKKRGTPPSAWDWRNYGLVTGVKNQNTAYTNCNSCVMFAVAATYEAFGPMTGGNFQDLSAQQILDCYSQDANVCVDGSSLSYAFQNLMGGNQLALSSASYYPYTAYQSYCNTPQSNFPLYGFSWGTGESQLLQQVYQQPVAALIDASCVEFQYYYSGILSYTGCTNTPNHAVTIIGFGTDPYYGRYWIGKNSWGTTWGEQGYFRFQMGYNYLSIASTYYFFPTNYGNYIQNPYGSNVYLNSPNGIMAPDMNSWMSFKTDGSLNVYNRQNQLIWSSYTGGMGVAPYQLYLQYDGDLCIYDSYGTRTWCSTGVSSTSAVYQLSMQNSGSLVVSRSGGTIWSTNTYVPL